MTRKQPFYIVVLFTLLEPTWREIFDLQTSVHHRQRRWRLQLRRENKHYITLTLHVCAFKNALKTIKYHDEYDQKIIQDLTLFEKNYGKTARVFGKVLGKVIRYSTTITPTMFIIFPPNVSSADTNRNIKMSVYCHYGQHSLTFRALALRQRKTFSL